MASGRILLTGLFPFLVLAVPDAWAQHEFGVTPFGGARFGGAIDVKSSWDYGANFQSGQLVAFRYPLFLQPRAGGEVFL
jgi:hypothetical protein